MHTSKITEAVAEKDAQKTKINQCRSKRRSSVHASGDLELTACAVTVGNTVATTSSPRGTAIGSGSLAGVDGLLDAVLEARSLGGDRLEALLTTSLGTVATLLLEGILALYTLGLAFGDCATLGGVGDAVAVQCDHLRVGNANVSGLEDLAGVLALADPADD